VKPWRLLSVLLQYPDPELYEARDELRRAAEGDARLERFLDRLGEISLAGAQRAYVETFDFDRRATLYLTFHTHGDRRQRGLELVRLKSRYAEAGLTLGDGELPDYLPVLLEFAALEPEQGEELLNGRRATLELVRARLHDLRSPYTDLLDALVSALPKLKEDQVAAARRLADEGPPTELVGLELYPVGASS
jgi:nitrate reductase molybdenum cofactor assembly chaperone NarJ/NarW